MKIQSMLRVAALSLALSMALPQVASAQNRWVTVVNKSSYTVWVLYGTNTGNTSWGNDRLGGEIIRPGWEIRINFSDGSGACLFDLKAETKSGRNWTRMGADVCTLNTWTLYD